MGTLAAALFVGLVALVLGHAACVLCRHDPRAAAAPAVGLSLVMLITWVAVRLPGHATTAAVLVIALALAATALLLRRGALRISADYALVGVAAASVALVPFLVNGRVGILGVSFNNDLSTHLLIAQNFLSWHAGVDSSGYPTGPHTLVAMTARTLGTDVGAGFTGLLIAVPVLTALTALGALRDLTLPRKIVAGLLVAFAYLAAAYYGEGAYKETMMGLLLVAFPLTLREASNRKVWTLSGSSLILGVVPAGLLIAGFIETYSYLGAIWPLVTLSVWFLVELAPQIRFSDLRRAGVELGRAGLATVGVAAVGLIPQVPRIVREFHQLHVNPSGSAGISAGSLGNLAHPLSPYEMFGIWPRGDFRFFPDNLFHAGALGAVGVGVAIASGVWWVRRRDFAVPAAVFAAVVIYFVSRHSQTPYTAAKALAIGAPVVMLMSARALLARREHFAWLDDSAMLRTAIGAIFIAGAVTSSYLALRTSQVGPTDHARELGSWRAILRGRQVLYMGYDDYISFELRGASVSNPAPVAQNGSILPVAANPAKPWSYGQPFDWDSVEPQTLDQFDYVITPRTDYASQAPASFKEIRATKSFELFKRVGPTSNRLVLPEAGAPGALLDCRKRPGRRVSQMAGVATLRPATVFRAPLGALLSGQSEAAPLRLSAGRWAISLQYTAPQPIRMSGPGIHTTMPANLDRPGPFFAVGQTVMPHAGTAVYTLSVSSPFILHSAAPLAFPSALVATRLGPAERVPLHAACGRVVDWYSVSPKA